MGASSIFFNGRNISVPGSYSTVDASALEAVGLTAAGRVAVLGTGEGGRPASDITELEDFIVINKPEKAREIFRSGDLREVADMLFAPSNDDDIQGGAVEMVAMKINPSTQSSATLPNAYGDCLDLESVDYGEFTKQVNILIGDGTTQGKLITITFEDTVESVDDLGGDGIFKLTYVNPGDGWGTMVAGVDSGGDIFANGTRTGLGGLSSDIASQPTVQDKLTVESDNAADVGMQVIIYGAYDPGSGVLGQQATVVLDGTTPVETDVDFGAVGGARVVGTTAGTVTIKDKAGTPVTVITIAAGTDLAKGLEPGVAMYVSGGKITVVADAATTDYVGIAGYSPTGAAQIEAIQLNGTTPVSSAGDWSEITYFGLGTVNVARTLTVSAEAARSQGSVQNTILKAADYYNARKVGTDGFDFTIVTGLLNFDPADLDVTTGAGGTVNVLSTANPDFYADLWAVINWINTSSQLMNATKHTGAVGGAPSNTPSAVFLAGGIEGTPLFSHWQGALDLLKKAGIDSVVPLTGDPAVHAACDAHCAYMGGIGRAERDGLVGLLNTGLTDVATKSEIKSQIVDLNSRHIRACAQPIERYNTAGERQEFPSYFQAAVAAGMQAGSAIGESLTFKYANVLSIRQDASWNPVDDAEEMIQAGLFFMESVDGVGRRVVRNVTTHLTTSNLAFTEASVNEAVNLSVKTLRTALEIAVGAKGFAGTINSTKGVATTNLGLLVDAEIITTWRNLGIELIVDVLEVAVEIAPIIPINFVKNVVHLVTIQQTAA